MVAPVVLCELVLWDLLGGIGKIQRKAASVFVVIQSECLKCHCLSHHPECIHCTEGFHVPGAIQFRHVEAHTFEFLYSHFTYTVVKTHLTTSAMGYWLPRLTVHLLY